MSKPYTSILAQAAAAFALVACGSSDPASVPAADGSMAIDAASDQSCSEGRICSESCVALDDVAACGPSCTQCPVPTNADATCDGTSCGFACSPGFHECDGECVEEKRSCGVPLPSDACDSPSSCGEAGECIDSTCVCAVGFSACTAGCCPVTYATTTLANVEGDGVQLEYGSDGTAYILVQVEAVSGFALQLYTRAPAATTIVRETLTIPVGFDRENFDFAVREDGTVFVAASLGSAESAAVDLYEWRAGMAEATVENMGSAFGFNVGLGLAIDGDQTVWASWSRQRSGGLNDYSQTLGGVRQTHTNFPSGTISQTDVEWNPAQAGVHSFWGHRYTGSFVSGQEQLAGATPLATTCPADDAAFDANGRLWTIFNSYSSIVTHFCLDGVSVEGRDAIARSPRLPTRFDGPIVVDGEDTAFVSFYEQNAYTAHWLSSRDGESWARGELPIIFGNPMGATSPARAHVSSARAPSGRISIVVLPSNATMGEMTLVDLQ